VSRKPGVAKLFTTGRSQAVRLPKEFRFEGDEVRIRRVKGGVLLEPIVTDPNQLFRQIDSIGELFMAEGRNQPPAPREDFFP